MEKFIVPDKKGFTIIEIMIVLAVTMILFFMATVFIDGKESYNEFIVAVNNLQSELISASNDVVNGTFPNSQYNCISYSASSPPNIISGNKTQGSRNGCVFLGSALQFNQNNLVIYPIVGNQTDLNGNSTNSFFSPGSYPVLSSYTGTKSIEYSSAISLSCMQYSVTNSGSNACSTSNYASNPKIGALAIGYSPISSTQNNDTQSLNTLPLPINTSWNLTNSNFIMQFNNYPKLNQALTQIKYTGGIEFCMKSNGTNNSALFTIGGTNTSSYIGHLIFNTNNCT